MKRRICDGGDGNDGGDGVNEFITFPQFNMLLKDVQRYILSFVPDSWIQLRLVNKHFEELVNPLIHTLYVSDESCTRVDDSTFRKMYSVGRKFSNLQEIEVRHSEYLEEFTEVCVETSANKKITTLNTWYEGMNIDVELAELISVGFPNLETLLVCINKEGFEDNVLDLFCELKFLKELSIDAGYDFTNAEEVKESIFDNCETLLKQNTNIHIYIEAVFSRDMMDRATYEHEMQLLKERNPYPERIHITPESFMSSIEMIEKIHQLIAFEKEIMSKKK